MEKRALQITLNDNTAVVLDNVLTGETVKLYSIEGEFINELIAKEDIHYLHKIAIQKIPMNEDIIKYGETIGYSIENIDFGKLVHTHNMKSKPQIYN